MFVQIILLCIINKVPTYVLYYTHFIRTPDSLLYQIHLGLMVD